MFARNARSFPLPLASFYGTTGFGVHSEVIQTDVKSWKIFGTYPLPYFQL